MPAEPSAVSPKLQTKSAQGYAPDPSSRAVADSFLKSLAAEPATASTTCGAIVAGPSARGTWQTCKDWIAGGVSYVKTIGNDASVLVVTRRSSQFDFLCNSPRRTT